mgnify:CR=1 FL=1
MLVQVALIIFAMSAMLSLIIDIGYARITQGQMQNAADSAAIEGIRQRDAVADAGPPGSGQHRCRLDVRRQLRPDRWRCGLSVRRRPDHRSDRKARRAFMACRRRACRHEHVYKPNLQANPGNAPEGDMVSGRFCYSADPLPSESVAYELQDTVCGQPQLGAAHTRETTSTPAAPNPNAFLVRLRRSNEYQDLEGRTDPDVAIERTVAAADVREGDDDPR